MQLLMLAWLSISVVVGSFCHCRSSKSSDGNFKHDDGTTTTIKPDVAAGSRGIPVGTYVPKAPGYLAHAYGAHHDLDRKHGRLKGFGVFLDKDLMITHRHTFGSLNEKPKDGDFEHGPHLFHPAPSYIHVNQGEPELNFLNHKLVQPNLGGSNFDLVKNIRYQSHWANSTVAPHFDPPMLEKNKQEFGTNCHMLTYHHRVAPGRSRFDLEDLPIWPHPKQKEWDRKFDFPDRHLSQIPVKLKGKGCKSGLCTMEVQSFAEVCPHVSSKGSPILCGEQKKVTYLTHGSKVCMSQFEAFHVPHMIDDINKGLGSSSE